MSPSKPLDPVRLAVAYGNVSVALSGSREASCGYIAQQADPERDGGRTQALFDHLSTATHALVAARSELERLANEADAPLY